MCNVDAQLRIAAAINKSEDFIHAVHPHTNKRFVSAMQSVGHSIKDMNNVKFDPLPRLEWRQRNIQLNIYFVFYLW